MTVKATKHRGVRRCAWCGQKVKGGKGTGRGKRGARYCPTGCGPKPTGRNSK